MRYIAVRELTGTAIPAQFRHGDLFIDGFITFLLPTEGYKYICASCGFIMRGGSPACCCSCLSIDLIIDHE